MGENVIFCATNSSSAHTDNRKKDVGEGPTVGLDTTQNLNCNESNSFFAC